MDSIDKLVDKTKREEANKSIDSFNDYSRERVWRLLNELEILVSNVREISLQFVDYYYERPENSPITKQSFLNDPFIKWLMEPNHILPEGLKRNNKIIKNVVIAMIQAGFAEAEFKDVAEKMCRNMPGKNISEFVGWKKRILRDESRSWSINYNELHDSIDEASNYG